MAGKTLGGSASLNGASWTKGLEMQYDVLPLLTGDALWGWEMLVEYMLKADNFHIDYVPTEEIAACKQSREVFLTPPLADMIVDEDQPGDLVRGFEQWERWVKESFPSVWHYMVTLAMMKEELDGVVNARLRVDVVANLRGGGCECVADSVECASVQ